MARANSRKTQVTSETRRNNGQTSHLFANTRDFRALEIMATFKSIRLIAALDEMRQSAKNKKDVSENRRRLIEKRVRVAQSDGGDDDDDGR